MSKKSLWAPGTKDEVSILDKKSLWTPFVANDILRGEDLNRINRMALVALGLATLPWIGLLILIIL